MTAPVPKSRMGGISRGFLAGIIAVVLLLVFTGAMALLLLRDLRDAERSREAQRAGAVAASLAQLVERQMQMADLLLQFANIEIGRGLPRGILPSDALNNLLTERVELLPNIEAVHVFDRRGDLWFVAGSAPMPLNIVATDLFRRHREGARRLLTADSAPIAPRLWLSRRIDTAEGQFDGVLIASLSLQISDLLERETFGTPVDALALVYEDGRPIAARRTDRLAELLPHRKLQTGPSGAATMADGAQIYWARVHDFPLYILLKLPPHAGESGWRRITSGYFLLLGMVGLGTVAALGTIWRQLRRRAASEAILRGLMDNPPIVIALLDPAGRYLMANRYYCEVLGVAEKDLIGRTAQEVMPPDVAARFEKQLAETVAAGHALLFDAEERRREGKRRYYMLMRFPIYDDRGDLLATGAIAIDITERKQLEAALREQRQLAETANRAKSEFLAHMSHELRTPLNAVIGFADMIASRMLGAQSPKYFEYAEDISRSAHHLLGVINDILDVSKIESGRFELDRAPHDLRGLVEDGLRLVQGRAREGGVKLANRLARDLPQVHVDARAIKQILINLLSNAVKFTPSGGIVTVDGSVAADGSVRLVVRDTGAGIAPEHLPRLFEPFWQANAGIRRSEGSGLGLSICRKLAELHDGSISVASEPGSGTQVTVLFPPGTAVPEAVQ
ncbi:MAG TPA: ATP-binding protein [Ferrovibrio sp.]|uniref:ATP-binding protein n=1 Tax=Ferrovibrio sp. TaxID=1917215 RepID=UPI002ED1FB3A